MQKLKKFFPYFLVVLFLGWASYKFFIERKAEPEQKMTLDWDQLDANSGSEPLDTPATIKKDEELVKEPKTREYTTLSQSEDEKFEAFDRMEKKWLAEVKTVIGDSNYARYLEMRELNEKEKMEAYKEYHDYLRKKYGDNFKYNISEDQSIREKKINQKYLQELMELIGKEKFQAYIKARDKINEENRRNGKEFIQVEF